MEGRVGPYILEKLLGRGATASVYLAVRENDGQRVALKVFHPIYGGEASMRRAAKEFRAVSALEHPNIVRVLSAHDELDPPALAMEFVEGESLEHVQARLPYVLPELSLRLGIEILRALEAAHDKGIVHRDLKPANILLSRAGELKVTDFGHSKFAEASQATATGTVLGSPDYMAPEQAQGESATPACDIFSLGSLLYFLVTGTRPFSRPTPLATLAAVVQAEVEPAHRRNPKMSAAASRIVARAMARDPTNRFASAREFREAIEGYLRGVGLGPELLSLSEWQRHPHEVVLDSLRSVASSAIRSAESQISQGRFKEALESIQHLSLVAPESPSVPRLMEKLSAEKNRRRRRKALWPVATGAGLAVGLGLFLGRFGSELLPVEATPVAHEQNSSPSSSLPTPAARVTPVLATRTVSTRETQRRAETRARAAVERYPVSFDLDPSVKVYWNGTLVDRTKPFSVTRTGAHKVRFEKAGARPLEHTVLVKESEPTHIRVR